MSNPLPDSLTHGMRAIASAETVHVTCVQCGTPSEQPAVMPGRPADWRTMALCANCARTTGRADALTRLRDDARTAWVERVRAFDRVTDYTEAMLGHNERPNGVDARLTNAVDEWNAASRTVDVASTESLYRGGFVLFGPTGVGKTRASFAVLNALASRVNPHTIEFGTEPALFGSIAPWEAPQRMTRLLDGREALLIDDAGTASYASVDARLVIWRAFAEAIAQHDRRLLLIITTNRSGWGSADGGADHLTLTDWIGPQVASRLRQLLVMMPVGFTDHRTGVEHSKFKTWVAKNVRT